VVNNNAAAVLIVLDTLCKGREVIVSRGQLVEIGGSFRIPEVMAKSGAILREVGATNRTHLRDYEAAITSDTAALMKVHTSNYRMTGFVKDVPLCELKTLAGSYGLPVIEDLGSGSLLRFEADGLPGEPTAIEAVAEGADGVRRLYAVKRLRMHKNDPAFLLMRVGIPEAQALAEMRRIKLRNVALMVGATMLAVALAFVLGNLLIMRRVNRLTTAAVRLGQGDLTARSGLGHPAHGIRVAEEPHALGVGEGHGRALGQACGIEALGQGAKIEAGRDGTLHFAGRPEHGNGEIEHWPTRTKPHFVVAHGEGLRPQHVLEILAPRNVQHPAKGGRHGENRSVGGDEREAGVGWILAVQLGQKRGGAGFVHLADGGHLGQGGQKHARILLHLPQIARQVRSQVHGGLVRLVHGLPLQFLPAPPDQSQGGDGGGQNKQQQVRSDGPGEKRPHTPPFPPKGTTSGGLRTPESRENDAQPYPIPQCKSRREEWE